MDPVQFPSTQVNYQELELNLHRQRLELNREKGEFQLQQDRAVFELEKDRAAFELYKQTTLSGFKQQQETIDLRQREFELEMKHKRDNWEAEKVQMISTIQQNNNMLLLAQETPAPQLLPPYVPRAAPVLCKRCRRDIYPEEEKDRQQKQSAEHDRARCAVQRVAAQLEARENNIIRQKAELQNERQEFLLEVENDKKRIQDELEIEKKKLQDELALQQKKDLEANAVTTVPTPVVEPVVQPNEDHLSPGDKVDNFLAKKEEQIRRDVKAFWNRR